VKLRSVSTKKTGDKNIKHISKQQQNLISQPMNETVGMVQPFGQVSSSYTCAYRKSNFSSVGIQQTFRVLKGAVDINSDTYGRIAIIAPCKSAVLHSLTTYYMVYVHCPK
jgi:hypothetical protein